MTYIRLLEALRDFSEETTKGLLLPVRQQSDILPSDPKEPSVYIMRMPESRQASKKAPYMIHQFLTSKDIITKAGEQKSLCAIRTVFCVYSDDEQEGAMHLLNLMERMRIAMLKNRILDNRFLLDMETGVEMLIWPEDTAPYYAGEMSHTWEVPTIKKEVVFE